MESKYFNRELSWLEFNERVLEEAFDKTNPLLERLKFLAISASNLDEFFMIRVASIMNQIEIGYRDRDPSGMTPKEQIKAISARVHDMVARQYNCLLYSILPALEKEGIKCIKMSETEDEHREYLRIYFREIIYPVLTPMAIDESRPFPLLLNKSLNLGVRLERNNGEEAYSFVQVPAILPRVILIPGGEGSIFIYLEEVIKEFIGDLYPGQKILAVCPFRITRNGDLDIDESDSDDLLKDIENSIKRRKWGFPVRVEIAKGMDEKLKRFLIDDLEREEEEKIDIADDDIYEIQGPLDLTMWMSFTKIKGYDHLKNDIVIPQRAECFDEERGIFDIISEGDKIVHHPYETFDHVLDFLRAAANDPDVLAIKQTLYRVSGDSPVVKSLIQAAENGKQVTVLVEIKARFDEENNILWAKRLERAGCHVVYGLVGLKTHCKVLLVVRKEEEGIKRYVHLGTGNYNDTTAKLYTDIGLFTCSENIGADVSALFNLLTGYSIAPLWRKLAVAPEGLRRFFITMINNEIKHKKAGGEARIIGKMNSLVDPEIIEKLYEASQAGVKIDLIVRGTCSLRPQVTGLSENIKVISVVGRFLEHERIFYFESNGEGKVFLGSADWMQRNLDRRIEVVFPVEEESAKEKIKDILAMTLRDSVKARVQMSDGTYTRVDKRGKETINSQKEFYEQAVKCMKRLRNSEEGLLKPIYKVDER